MAASLNFTQAIKASLLFLLLVMSSSTVAADKEESRDKVRQTSKEVLARLYAVQPSARGVIAGSRGYATFSRWGLTLGPIGGGIGKGLAVAKPSGAETFMRFVEGSAGLGFGIKKYDVIFVFQNDEAFKDFVTKGWQAKGKATAAAKGRAGGKVAEGAISLSPGLLVYQNTEKGLAAELGISGTKYYTDKSRN